MKLFTYTLVALSLVVFYSCSASDIIQTDPNYVPPKIKYQPKLMYPMEAQQHSTTGFSEAMLLVSEQGTVERVDIITSTGSEILDKSSVEYFNKLLFTPAMRNNTPTYSLVKWAIKYTMLDYNWNPFIYVGRIEELNSQLANEIGADRLRLENSILNEHDDYLFNMSDVINFNTFLEKVISDDITKEWKNDWNSYPLSFLIYHDFLTRYADYDSLAKVKDRLYLALSNDVQYIENTEPKDYSKQESKTTLLGKIKTFVSDKYPDIYQRFYDTQINRKETDLNM